MWQGLEISGKYKVERVLGEGGMGIVLFARHLELGHPVAIKCLRREFADHAEARGRFEREARAAAALTSEHVAHVTDVGRMPDGTPFMVMEYLEGEDLACRVDRDGPLPAAFAIECMMQACEGLAEAHHKGIVHRDIKPSKLFLVRRPSGRTSLKVLDFGIAKAVSSGGAELTRTSAIVGSPLYMSPEQLRESKDVDARTDVWSLGVTLFHMLTKRYPFEAEAVGEIYGKILYTEPLKLRACDPALPEELERIIDGCLTKDPSQRIDSVTTLAARLTTMDAPAPLSSAYSHASLRSVPEPQPAHTAPRERSGGTTLAMETQVLPDETTFDGDSPHASAIAIAMRPSVASHDADVANVKPTARRPRLGPLVLFAGLAIAAYVLVPLATRRGEPPAAQSFSSPPAALAPALPVAVDAAPAPPPDVKQPAATPAQTPAPMPVRPATPATRAGAKGAALAIGSTALEAGHRAELTPTPLAVKAEAEVPRAVALPPPPEKRKRSSVLEMQLE